MGTFDDMFDHEAAEHQRRVDDAQARKELAHREAVRAYEQGVAKLEEEVYPVLVEAQTSFTTKGVPVDLTKSWSLPGVRPASPRIDFVVGAPLTQSEHDPQRIKIVAQGGEVQVIHSEMRSTAIASLREAIQKALRAHYEREERRR